MFESLSEKLFLESGMQRDLRDRSWSPFVEWIAPINLSTNFFGLSTTWSTSVYISCDWWLWLTVWQWGYPFPSRSRDLARFSDSNTEIEKAPIDLMFGTHVPNKSRTTALGCHETPHVREETWQTDLVCDSLVEMSNIWPFRPTQMQPVMSF